MPIQRPDFRLPARRFSLASALLLAALFAGCNPRPIKTPGGSSPNGSTTGAGQLTYVQIDVGQGDSSLLISPDGHAMLVDAGPPGHADKILSVMRKHGVKKLDYVVESHPHADHIGSLAQVLKDGPPVQVFLASGYQHNSSIQKKMLQTVKEKVPEKGKYVREGNRFTLGNAVTFDILQPRPPLIRDTESDPNNNSVVLRVTYGDVHFLLTGDMEREERERLLDTQTDFGSDVLKVSHHGSQDGVDPGFIRRVRPRFALISCETGNDYGHPHPEAIKSISEIGATIYRTDLQGDLTIRTDGREIAVETEKVASLPVTLSGREVSSRQGKSGNPERRDAGDLAAPRPEGKTGASGKSPSETGRRANPSSEETRGDEPIIGNKRSKVYHREGSGTNLPAPGNRVYFQSEAEAKEAGYRSARP